MEVLHDFVFPKKKDVDLKSSFQPLQEIQIAIWVLSKKTQPII